MKRVQALLRIPVDFRVQLLFPPQLMVYAESVRLDSQGTSIIQLRSLVATRDSYADSSDEGS